MICACCGMVVGMYTAPNLYWGSGRACAGCEVCGLSGGGFGVPGGTGGSSEVTRAALGSTCGNTIGATIAHPTSSASPVIPTHVAQKRLDPRPDGSVDCSNIVRPLSFTCMDTLLLKSVEEWGREAATSVASASGC